MTWRPLSLAAACLSLGATPALAGEVYAGAFDHAPSLHIGAADEEHGVDIQVGVRSERIDTFRHIGRPRAYVLLSKNLAGQTDFASAGLLWRHDFGSRIYGQIGLGLAIHDGVAYPSEQRGRLDRRPLGSRILFQEEASIGYRASPRWAIEATYVHISNAHLWTDINPGMDDIGGRLVYRFGGAP